MKKWIVAGLAGMAFFSHGYAQQTATKKTDANKTTGAGNTTTSGKSSAAGRTTATAGKTFELNGSIAGLTSPKIMLRYETGGKIIIDTADVVNGTFVFKGSLDGPTFSQMMATNFKFMHNQYLDNSNMTIVKMDSTSDVVVTGSATEDENTAFNKYRSRLGDKTYLLRQELEKLRETDSAGADTRASKELYPLYDSMNIITVAYIRAHPKSLVSLFQLSNIAQNIDTKELSAAFSSLDKPLQESKMGKELAASIEAQQKTAIGVAAPVFTQKNTKGNDISLSSYKGKYVLVDFWASWCGPCRMENPNVTKAYGKYKGKGFTILGVSLDQDSTKWIAAVDKDQLAWEQVSDLKGWGNVVAAQYGVSSIPANFLIGPDGLIVAKNLRGEALDKKLAELFDK